MRSKFEQKGLKPRGLLTTEPNESGVLHINLLLFFPTKEESDLAEIIIKNTFFNDDKETNTKLDNEKSRNRRIKAFQIDTPEKWANYITKNIRNSRSASLISTGQCSKLDSDRIDAWHATWGVRRYSFCGQLPIYYWRGLQITSHTAIHKAQSKHPLPSMVRRLWESASSRVYVGNKLTIGKYDYREFMRLTEPDAIYYQRRMNPKHTHAADTLKIIRFRNKPYTSEPNRFAIQIIDPNRPDLMIHLYRRRYHIIDNEYYHYTDCKRYVKYSLQLCITLPSDKATKPNRQKTQLKPP